MADRRLALHGNHDEAGALFGGWHGWLVPRHYGNPEAEYVAASTGVGVMDRSFRGRLGLDGRAPGQMLQGILTNHLPGPLTGSGSGGSIYSAVLTPKGRMVSDLRVFRLDAEPEAFLLDVPAAGVDGLRGYFDRYLPPRFARVRDLSGELGHLTFIGPGASATLADLLGPPGAAPLTTGEYRLVAGGPEAGGWLLAGNGEVGGIAIDVIAAVTAIETLWTKAIGKQVASVGRGVWDTLRVEAGTPLFGVDTTDTTIPLEAGLDHAIDHGKGCYTGQEVIVRIRHRGHVNWRLRRLRFGQEAAPREGAELFDPETGKVVGRITSAVQSPRAGEGLGLGYVRREVGLPGSLRLDARDGSEVTVESNEGLVTPGG